MKVLEQYKGYSICSVSNGKLYTEYLTIYKEDTRITTMPLTSIQACKNVIDTHERSVKEKNIWIVKD